MRVPFPSRLLYWLARGLFAITGWHIDVLLPDIPKYVIVLAPHTSYWDGFIGIVAEAIVTCGYTTLQISWLGKHTLFRFPFGWLVRQVGGIPVDRRARHAMVEQVVETFRCRERLVLAITPEGARRKTRYWKTGFYYIAQSARIPILCVYIDYKTKTVGTGPVIIPSGNIHADLAAISEFYSHHTARYPDRVGEIMVPPL